MNINLTLVGILTLFSVCLTESVKPIDLNGENFDQLTENGVWFLKFYAPWCGHCKHLAPVVEEVAKSLDNQASVGKINCDDHGDLCRRFNVKGYPTLFIKKGKALRAYSGGRTREEILKKVKVMIKDPVEQIKEGMIDRVKDGKDVSFVAFHSATAPDWFQKVASDFQGESFFLTTTESPENFGVPANSKVSVFKDGLSFHLNQANEESFRKFVSRHRYSLLPELKRFNYHEIVVDSGRRVFLAFESSKQPNGKLREISKDVSAEFGDRFTFAWSNADNWERLLTHLEIKTESAPFILVSEVELEDGHYILPFSESTTKKDVTDFLDRISAGKEPKLGYSFLKSVQRSIKKGVEAIADFGSDHPVIFSVVCISFVGGFVVLLAYCEPAPSTHSERDQNEEDWDEGREQYPPTTTEQTNKKDVDEQEEKQQEEKKEEKQEEEKKEEKQEEKQEEKPKPKKEEEQKQPQKSKAQKKKEIRKRKRN